MNDDIQLLRRYVEHDDESAFTELVQRHVNLVWSTAYRVTRDADLARDVAQTVFAELARKADRVRPETVLADLEAIARPTSHAARRHVERHESNRNFHQRL